MQGRGKGGGLRSTPERSCRGEGGRSTPAGAREGRRSEVHSREVVQGRGRGGGLRSTPERSCRGEGGEEA